MDGQLMQQGIVQSMFIGAFSSKIQSGNPIFDMIIIMSINYIIMTSFNYFKDIFNQLNIISTMTKFFQIKKYIITLKMNENEKGQTIYSNYYGNNTGIIIKAVLDTIKTNGVKISDNIYMKGESIPNKTNYYSLKHGIRYIPQNQTVINYKNINIYISINFNVDTKEKSIISTQSITIYSYKNIEIVNEYLMKIYNSYVDNHYKNDDTKQFIYEYNQNDSINDKTFIYSRYKLKNNKTFENIFHPLKNDIISLIDNFTHKKGKFGKKGMPYKLGFLLYGPPGTGKTSFIKAISNYTNRSIININLAHIKTSSEIKTLFHAKSIVYNDGGWKYKTHIKQSKKIYLLEDIDTVFDIVKQREEKKNDDKDIITNIINDNVDSSLESKLDKVLESKLDKFCLGDLLNAMDGIIELNGAILIMTTNHPNKLDSALIRTGRINMKILFDYIRRKELAQLINYYLDTSITENDFPNTIKDYMYTPSNIEEICQRSDNYKDVIQKILEIKPEKIDRTPYVDI